LQPALPGVVLDPEAGQRLAVAPGTRELRILIGPEGGLDRAEILLAERNGFSSHSLGPRVLRAETAPAAALAILQFLGGDL